MPSSTRYTRFAAARVASARSVPAISRASPLNAAVPATISSTDHTAPAAPPCGFQPSASPTTTIRTDCSTSTASTVSVFAAIRPLRASGVAPSRFSTPYRRSNPVAIAWLVKAVDSTARARMPGVRKSIRGPGP